MQTSYKFLYQEVFHQILAQIKNGRFIKGSLLPTEREIGELYKVDRSTTRKALQMLVDQGYVKKLPGKGSVVIDTMQHENTEKQETTDSHNESVIAKPKEIIGFFLPRSSNQRDRITEPFHSKLFYTSQLLCQQHNYTLLYQTLDPNDDFEEILQTSNFSGAIFLSNVDKKHIDLAVKNKLPAILINSTHPNVPCITPDNEYGMYLACNYLLDKGHQNIGVITPPPQSLSVNYEERLKGVKKALQERNLSLNDKFIIQGEDWDYTSGFEATRNFLHKTKIAPDALIGFNDRLALGAMHALQQQGYKIPDDIAIVGFDNSEDAICANPKITSVEINIKTIAQVACSFLFEQLFAYKDMPCRSFAPISIIERDSVKGRI